MRIKIVTLNTWDDYGPYRARWKYLLTELKSHEPDIIFLQEVSCARMTRSLLRGFPCHQAVAAYGPGLVVLSKYPIHRRTYIKYSTQSKEEDHERGFLSVEIFSGGRKILLGNTHLSWRRRDTPVRARQVRELIQIVKKFTGHSILAGDFNDTPDSQPVRRLKESGWRDWFETVHPKRKGITWDNRNQFIRSHSVKFLDRRIDFIFTDPKLTRLVRKKTSKVIMNKKNKAGIFPSDHYGVYAAFDLPDVTCPLKAL